MLSGIAEMSATATPSAGIEIRDVSKTYGQQADGVLALATCNLTIRPGEFVAIVGPSGCGKSTLMRLIAGLIAPSSGAITVFGRRVSGPFHDCGIVFQQPILLEWRNVLDNVLFQVDMRGLDVDRYREQALRLLEQVGLAEFAAKRPYELSGGMKQRAAIARALVHDPPLLLMDEPFGALDEIVRDKLNQQLLELWDRTKKTVVFVTHSIPEAVFLSTKIVVMSPRPGRVTDVIETNFPRNRTLDFRETPEFLKVAHRVREGLRAGHSYED
jgi:NitT/TauT family transport system ATP-binding protein